MFELQKMVLENVSEDRNLFKKEIMKSFQWLESYEIDQLYKWLIANYGETHKEEISNAFQYITA